MSEKKGVTINAIWLRREGNKACVLAEIDGVWVPVIEEVYDGAFSHIVEEGGIESRRAAVKP